MSEAHPTTRSWRIGGAVELPLDRPQLIGIVNATPDSFSDGRSPLSVDVLLGHALRLVHEGAVVIDIGGESTRPGSPSVSEQEQIDRAIPLIAELHRIGAVLISIDTTRAAVARAALDAGAVIINDVSAGRDDEAMLPLAASRECGLILMHRLRSPRDDSYSDRYVEEPTYDDVLQNVRTFLLGRCREADAAGVRRDAVVIDPGLGFGKTVDQNYELIARTDELVRTGFPVVSGASRKSFVGAVTNVETPRDRVFGSTAISVAQYLAGVRLFRVHDVAAHREALAVARAVEEAAARQSAGAVG